MEQMEKKATLPNTGAVERIVLRNNFYRDNYHRLMLICIGLIFICTCLLFWAFYERAKKPMPRYFATTYDGKLIPLIPLNQANLTDNELLQWAVEAAVACYSFNYENYRKALQDARIFFTKEGYEFFMRALNDSNNLQAVIEKKMIVSAKPTGAAVVLNQGAKQGLYSWDVKLPMEISYRNETTPIRQYVVLTMRIVRTSTLESPSGVGIVSYVVTEGKPS